MLFSYCYYKSQKLSPPLRKGRRILVMRLKNPSLPFIRKSKRCHRLSTNFESLLENDFNLDMYEDKNKHLDILKFWRDHARVYPKLALVARLILACPASSTPSERSFSQAGWTINLRHTRLATRNLNALLCIQSYMSGSAWKALEPNEPTDLVEADSAE